MSNVFEVVNEKVKSKFKVVKKRIRAQFNSTIFQSSETVKDRDKLPIPM